MPRSIQIYIPPDEHGWYRGLLEKLAGEIITDAEAGQRGAKLSRLIQMLATAYVADPDGVVEHMRAIKKSASELGQER